MERLPNQARDEAFETALAQPLQQLQTCAERADHVLTPEVYDQAWQLFQACMAEALRAKPDDRRCLADLRRIAPDYGRPEFFLTVDSHGVPAPPDEALLAAFRHRARRYPPFELWFREARARRSGQSALLAARWFCHLAGLRHRTVQLFIDHPLLDDYTLVQVRSLSQIDYPGCYDVPVAGHATGIDSVETTLSKELREKLNLDLGDIDRLQRLGSYDHARLLGPAPNGSLVPRRDIEYRALYGGRLRPDALLRIRFADGEVGGITVFRLDELRQLVERLPERVASDVRHPRLLNSLPWYLRARES